MGLISFVKSAGRKVGLFGGQAAVQAEVEAAQATKHAEAAVAAAQAAAAAHDEAEKARLQNLSIAADMVAAVTAHGIAIQGFAVTFDDETATVTGTATSQSDREKAVLIVGNTEGCGAVDDQLDVEIPAPPAVYHTVVSGDTLSKIAMVQYGVMRLYDPIFEANRPMLQHPDEIYPGQVLRIPPVAAPIHTVAAGDTLGAIAKHWYGDARKYSFIFDANRNTLASPDVVEVGQQLTIPLSTPAVA